jgi:hypothetical protein
LIELHSPDRAEEKLIQLTFDPYDPLYVVQQFILGKCHIYHRNWNSARKKFEYVLNQLNRHFEFDKSNLAAVCHLYLCVRQVKSTENGNRFVHSALPE